MSKVYATRDHISQGEYYLRHIDAMTGEGLHAKSAIAAELAHRDIEIDRLRAEIERLHAECERWESALGAVMPDDFKDWHQNSSSERPEVAAACITSLRISEQYAWEMVERLRADSERLDYIEKRARCDPKMDGQHVWWPTNFNHRLTGPTLRAAIDAARGDT